MHRDVGQGAQIEFDVHQGGLRGRRLSEFRGALIQGEHVGIAMDIQRPGHAGFQRVIPGPGGKLHHPGEYYAMIVFAVLGATLVIGAVFVAINKGSDALYRLLDPRART